MSQRACHTDIAPRLSLLPSQPAVRPALWDHAGFGVSWRFNRVVTDKQRAKHCCCFSRSSTPSTLPPPTDLFLQVFDLPPLDLCLVLQVADPLQRLMVRERKKDEEKAAEGKFSFSNRTSTQPHASNWPLDNSSTRVTWWVMWPGCCYCGSSQLFPPQKWRTQCGTVLH